MRGTQDQASSGIQLVLFHQAVLEVHFLTVLFICPLVVNTIDDLSRNGADSSVPSGTFLKRPRME